MMLRKAFEAVEGLIFDATMAVMIPVLTIWAQHGLKSEELSDELREFWQQMKESV